jgi:4-amino-4-deoxy-L-arabinose transferase-like glycosyltransferase
MNLLSRIAREPGLAAGGFIGAQIAIWTLVPFVSNHSLPLDVVREGLSWGQEWQWGYFKHPPLPSWLVNISFEALGDFGPYLLSQICVGLTLYFAYRLGREMFDETRAALGTLLLGGIYYFSWPSPEFNHNVALMPAWAAAIYFFHRGLATRRYIHWIALGAAAGLGLLGKYSMAVLLVVMLGYMLARHEHRRHVISGPSFAALAVMTAIAAPHLVWLADHDFQPLFYLEARAGDAAGIGERIFGPVKFLLAQVADHIPLLVLLAAAGSLRRQSARTETADAGGGAFLLVLGLGPALLTAMSAMVLGSGLRDMWGAPMWCLSGLLAVNYFVQPDAARVLRRVTAGVALLLIAVPAAYAAAAIYGTAAAGKPSRTGWPDRALAAALEQAWRGETECPLGIVAGENWIAGLVSMRATGRPSVLIEGRFELSPWIGPERLNREGALVVWQESGDGVDPPAHLGALAGFDAKGAVAVPWPRGPELVPLRVGWGIIAPAAPCGGD